MCGLSMNSPVSPSPRRFQPRSSALRPGQEGALMRGVRHRPPLPGERRHHDRDGQLRPDRRQDLRR